MIVKMLSCRTQCDKHLRAPDARDPGSECRQFGGPNRQCTPAKNTSYNDGVYRLMLIRYREEPPYSLPAFKTARNNKGPISANNVRPDWQGQSAETLLSKPDFLPSAVRTCPRAFTVPQRSSISRDNSRLWNAQHQNPARRMSGAPPPPPSPYGSSNAMPRLSVHPPAPTAGYQRFAQPMYEQAALPSPQWQIPPVDPVAGRVLLTTWDHIRSEWTREYENGARVTVPTMHYPHLSGYSSQAPRSFDNVSQP
jgi:hypothetical protein